MTAQIISLPVIRIEHNEGNGARGALIDIALTLAKTSRDDAEKWSDWLLMEMWSRGFMVSPIPEDDPE